MRRSGGMEDSRRRSLTVEARELVHVRGGAAPVGVGVLRIRLRESGGELVQAERDELRVHPDVRVVLTGGELERVLVELVERQPLLESTAPGHDEVGLLEPRAVLRAGRVVVWARGLGEEGVHVRVGSGDVLRDVGRDRVRGDHVDAVIGLAAAAAREHGGRHKRK